MKRRERIYLGRKKIFKMYINKPIEDRLGKYFDFPITKEFLKPTPAVMLMPAPFNPLIHQHFETPFIVQPFNADRAHEALIIFNNPVPDIFRAGITKNSIDALSLPERNIDEMRFLKMAMPIDYQGLCAPFRSNTNADRHPVTREILDEE